MVNLQLQNTCERSGTGLRPSIQVSKVPNERRPRTPRKRESVVRSWTYHPLVFKEEPPIVNEQGEQSEVQEFNPDEILANLYNPPPPPCCPRCNVPMSYGCIRANDGSVWYEYYRCPEATFFTKCYVTCGANELSEYLQRVQTQTHPCYNTLIQPVSDAYATSPWY